MAEYNSTSSGYPLTATIDPVNDVWLIWTNSVMAVQSINRNVALGLASGPVGLTDVQTLTNKTLTAPTISSPVLSGTATGTYTLGGTPTFPASVATLTGAQVLTNKTLTSPTINSPSITNATLTTDAVTGYTTSNSGVVYGGLTMTTGNAAFSGNATVGGTLGVTGVSTFTAVPVLPPGTITLGYTQVVANQATTSTTYVQVTGLTLTVTIPTGGRYIKITGYVFGYNAAAGDGILTSIWDGAVGSGTQLSTGGYEKNSLTSSASGMVMAIVQPAAGSKTYNIGFKSTLGGSANTNASSNQPAFILVEAI